MRLNLLGRRFLLIRVFAKPPVFTNSRLILLFFMSLNRVGPVLASVSLFGPVLASVCEAQLCLCVKIFDFLSNFEE